MLVAAFQRCKLLRQTASIVDVQPEQQIHILAPETEFLNAVNRQESSREKKSVDDISARKFRIAPNLGR